ncbi:hypothetical protein CP03DC29_0316B, partial [Chlamydia psittaci 03DC29]
LGKKRRSKNGHPSLHIEKCQSAPNAT